MRIEHVAVWTSDLEQLVAFYGRYFGALSGEKYTNQRTGFESYFLTFADGPRLELMRSPSVKSGMDGLRFGYAHLAISVGSESEVDRLTERLRNDGHRVVDGPRRTGDGYYESVILDPDGNRIEITV
jgi:lactoylglutathione lyase